MGESEYNKVHRLFLQTCAGSSCLPQEDALSSYRVIARKESATIDDMMKCIKQINKKLSPMAQEISLNQCGISKAMIVVFVDTSEAAIIKQQTNYSDPELFFFRDLLGAMATAPFYRMEIIAAINLTNQVGAGVKSIAKNRAEQLIEVWTDQGYLTRVDEVLHFGPRCLVEFGSFLQKYFSDYMIECMLCKVIVLKPIVCVDCSQRFHENCIRTYLTKTSNCAKCKQPWKVPLSS